MGIEMKGTGERGERGEGGIEEIGMRKKAKVGEDVRVG